MSAPCAVWKKSIQFGLVHVPVALYAAADEQPVDFHWLDERSMEPMGYQRINKITGVKIEPRNGVKGIAVAPSAYGVITEAEIAAATPKTRKTFAIESFVSNREIRFVYLGRPYYMAPINQGLKVYALVQDTLLEIERMGLARLVRHGKQHLAVLVPAEVGLMLNLLRWPADIRPWTELDTPTFETSVAGVFSRERAMACQLVNGMTHLWQLSQYGRDPSKERIQALAQHKVHLGLVQSVPALSLETEASAELPFDTQGDSQSTAEKKSNPPATLVKNPGGLLLSKSATTTKKVKSHVPKQTLH